MQIDDDLAHAASLHIHPRPGVTFEADEYDEATLARASDAAQAALNAAALQQLSLPEQSLPSAMHLQSVMKHYGGERAARVSVHVHGHNTHLKFSRKPQLLDAGRSADVSYHADRPGRGQSTSLPQLHPHVSPPNRAAKPPRDALLEAALLPTSSSLPQLLMGGRPSPEPRRAARAREERAAEPSSRAQAVAAADALRRALLAHGADEGGGEAEMLARLPHLERAFEEVVRQHAARLRGADREGVVWLRPLLRHTRRAARPRLEDEPRLRAVSRRRLAVGTPGARRV